LSDAGTSSEKELPEGNDGGYLWRLNSYWRFKQEGDGVTEGEPIVEVAHEPLLQRWPTLRGWLEEQREFLRQQGCDFYQGYVYSKPLPLVELSHFFGSIAGAALLVLARGLQRRVELAKSLLHRPEVLLLDEPSTGLDPGARHDLWEALRSLKGVTVLMTTHLLEEAERCDRLAILHKGKLVALGEPLALRGEIGGDVVTVRTRDAEALASAIKEKLGETPQVIPGAVRMSRDRGHELVGKLLESFPDRIESVTVAKPSLEDVFIELTGRRLRD
jgi:hypothetical protein